MILNRIIYTFYVICFSLLVCSCNGNEDDNYDNYLQSYLNATYQNYSDTETNKLILIYNGEELTNKEVSFFTTDNKVGKITFSNIIGEKETIISNILLKMNEEKGGLDFSGTYTATSSKKFIYSGNIALGILSLTLKSE